MNEFYWNILLFFFLKTPFDDFGQAVHAVREGHYWGVAAIRFNFSQAVKNKSVFDFKIIYFLLEFFF